MQKHDMEKHPYLSVQGPGNQERASHNLTKQFESFWERFDLKGYTSVDTKKLRNKLV